MAFEGIFNLVAVPEEAQKTIEAFKTLSKDAHDTANATDAAAAEVSHASIIDGFADTWVVLGGTALAGLLGVLLYKIVPGGKKSA